ncbi:hypothetical protein G9A89_015620 [Geosiphon pyriformis]|nr:hypothetical protein G9A89_015620 [Geosiphon pyriformis]
MPAVIPKGIQVSNWKKQRIKSPIYPSYYHTPRSIINITSTNVSTSMKTPITRILFQSKQAKVDLLGTYGFQSPSYQPDFRTTSSWKVTESEEEENEDQEFNYQNPILQNPEIRILNIQTQQHIENLEIGTLNIQTPPQQKNPNADQINQPNLPSEIIIEQPLNPLQGLLQQPVPPSQQLIQPVQQIAYTPIAKIEKFTGEEDNAQI